MGKSNKISPFKPLGDMPDVYVAHKAALRTTAIVLESGGLCLFSPALGWNDEAVASLDAIGSVTHLVAPNHYHNLGLADAVHTFPEAKLCCSASAAPRLERVTGLRFIDLSEVAFPNDWRVEEPPGLKSGEIWLVRKTQNLTTWIVADCFSGPRDVGGETWCQQPELLSTFPKYGLGDKITYLRWLKTRIADDDPKLLIPCHGAIVAGNRLSGSLVALADSLT